MVSIGIVGDLGWSIYHWVMLVNFLMLYLASLDNMLLGNRNKYFITSGLHGTPGLFMKSYASSGTGNLLLHSEDGSLGFLSGLFWHKVSQYTLYLHQSLSVCLSYCCHELGNSLDTLAFCVLLGYFFFA